MIQLHNVSMSYQADSTALNDLTLKIPKGDFVFLTGQSGAGKSTLLKLLYAELSPTRGQVLIDGVNLTRLSRSQIPFLRRSIGVVFQDAKLLPVRTVYENVAFVLRVLGTPRRDITARVFDALRVVGLSSRAQAYPAQLSQGEAQRAALARAIVRRPPLLLADEPTGSLDDAMAAEILEVLRDIWAGGTTVVLATHQARVAAALRRRTLALEAGRVVKDEG